MGAGPGKIGDKGPPWLGALAPTRPRMSTPVGSDIVSHMLPWPGELAQFGFAVSAAGRH